MLRFKREDTGLYIAMTLIGAGLGLLAGAFITARLNKIREEEEPEEEEWEDYYQKDLARQMTILDEAEKEEFKDLPEVPNVPIMSIDRTDRARGTTFPESTDLEKREFEKETKRDRLVHLSKEERIRLKELISEYNATPMQVNFVESGLMTIDELEEALEEEDFNNRAGPEETDPEEDIELTVSEVTHTDYNEPYRDDKPDMDDLLEKPIDDLPRDLGDLLVVVDEQWEILLEAPEGKALSNKKVIYYDGSDDSTVMLTKRGQTVAVDLSVMISPEVNQIIRPWLLFEEDLETIYVNDIRNPRTRWYEITRIKEDEDILDDLGNEY